MSGVAPIVGPEVLRQVKQIELRTRRIVGSLFSGEYRSVFRGQGIEFAEVRFFRSESSPSRKAAFANRWQSSKVPATSSAVMLSPSVVSCFSCSGLTRPAG